MKTNLHRWLIPLALLVGVQQAAAQGARFFRIVGPAATTITAFNMDGTLVWSNALAGTNYTVQTVTSLPGGSNWVDYVQLPVTQAVNTNLLVAFNPPIGMALIPAGSFQMGDNSDGDSDAPVHTVYISACYMDRYNVTYSLWQTVFNWAVTNGYSFDYVGSGKAANHPVQTISWYDCVKWCNARSEMEWRTPAYYTEGTQTTVYRSGDVDLSNDCVNWGAGYRLPTEAEWEKAARGGLSGQRFPWGNTISWSQANYDSTWNNGAPHFSYDLAPTSGLDPTFATGSYPYTSPVDYFTPNGYGLYDMAGNVVQWCWDWYDYDYYGTYGGGGDPHGPALGNKRVDRCGCWDSDADYCRTAIRSYDPFYRYGNEYCGFRSVLSPSQ